MVSQTAVLSISFVFIFCLNKQTKKKASISMVIRSSWLALHTDFGNCIAKIDALSEGQKAGFSFF